MAKVKVICPNKNFTGEAATVAFAAGVGYTDNPDLIEWFEKNDFIIEHKEQEDLDPDNENEVFDENKDNSETDPDEDKTLEDEGKQSKKGKKVK